MRGSRIFIGVISAAFVVTLGLACQVFENPRGPILCESWCDSCVRGVCDSMVDNEENQRRGFRLDAGLMKWPGTPPDARSGGNLE